MIRSRGCAPKINDNASRERWLIRASFVRLTVWEQQSSAKDFLANNLCVETAESSLIQQGYFLSQLNLQRPF